MLHIARRPTSLDRDSRELPARARALCVCAGLAAVLAAVSIAPARALAQRPRVPAVFAGTALWVREVAPGQTGASLVAEAAGAGVHTLYVKAGDGSTAEPQFSPALLGEMRAAGDTVCAWTFMYGTDPAAEAMVAASAARAGAQCLVIDAEGTDTGLNLYGAAQAFVHDLRSLLGGGFPIGLASQAEVAQHPTFPYSVFLGPGAFNVVLPLIYWRDFGQSVAAAYAATMGANAIYGRPILPVGQLYGSPSPTELVSFRALAGAYRSTGLSFFDLDVALPEELAALAAPAPAQGAQPILEPALRPGADGDEIVRAQELLNAAGARLPVGGYYGARTARALASFQARHHLRPNGLLGPATWRALLRLTPREPSWVKAPPQSAG